MLKITKIHTNKSQSEAGFTLLEVLVAMLIAFFFVLGSMQALVLATALRVKAQEKQRANQLIQEDIEKIRFEAETLSRNDISGNNNLCSASTFDIDNKIYDSIDDTTRDPDPDSYAEGLWEYIPSVPGNKQLLNDKGKTYGLSRTLAANSTSKVLKINFSVSPLDKNGNPEKKKDENGNVMKDKNGNVIVIEIATDHIEVIPNAAIEQCPN